MDTPSLHTAEPRRRAAHRRAWSGGRWFGRGRTRALLSLGVVLVLGAVGTSAFWTDTATVNAGTVTSGTMDLQLQVPRSTTIWEVVGTGGSVTDTTLAVGNLAPGESQAFNLAARNVGQPTFTYTALVAQAGTWTFVNNPIQVRFFAGATARASNTSAYPRTGTCSGTALGTGPVTVTPESSLVIPARTLASGASEQLCLVVSMVLAAANDNQGRTGSLRLDFSATQVAP